MRPDTLGAECGELSITDGADENLLHGVHGPDVVHHLGVLCGEDTDWAGHILSAGRMFHHV